MPRIERFFDIKFVETGQQMRTYFIEMAIEIAEHIRTTNLCQKVKEHKN